MVFDFKKSFSLLIATQNLNTANNKNTNINLLTISQPYAIIINKTAS